MKIAPTDVPNKKSNALTWITWHEAMKSSFGKKNANYLFSRAWNKRGGVSSVANTSDLREYLKKNGISIDKDWTASIIDTTGDFTDFFGDIFNVGKYAGIAFTVILVAGVGMLVYNVAKDPIKAAGAAAKLKGGI